MENIRIQDDLYTYVNQAKLDELVIPDDMPVAGGFATLATDVEKQDFPWDDDGAAALRQWLQEGYEAFLAREAQA